MAKKIVNFGNRIAPPVLSEKSQSVFSIHHNAFRLVAFLALPAMLVAESKNGFDVSNATIPASQIFRGAPRDAIPAIDEPRFTAASKTNWLRDDDLVFGVSVEGEHRAYPLRILVWHEIVNDEIAGQPVAVTYCPLCGTAMAFDRNIAGETLVFGVSGLLYQSDVLLFDRRSQSLWSQLGMEAVSGVHAGKGLKWRPGDLMTWKGWKDAYPESMVLSRETGHSRNYNRTPYQGYAERPETMFPFDRHRDDLGNKEWVLGVIHEGVAVAVHLAELAERGKPLLLQVGASAIEVRYHAHSRFATVRDPEGKVLPSVQLYWFAWQAFYPETIVWRG